MKGTISGIFIALCAMLYLYFFLCLMRSNKQSSKVLIKIETALLSKSLNANNVMPYIIWGYSDCNHILDIG
ncbi:hypothetical protein QE152_g14229 [Popillia japonica]|uniref:Uncharacterized protein n=1 Tax=Popillia japonica TaxID=7064 RepID=A0AAW1LAU4_POPJA